ncbi:hypothetical protein INT44_002166 [Umbelopsis vinacea]|uniref:SNF5-domain-containing protein n=1 Tax=Umbelopsis vinacea TaxID=44442 RepID=A0A8H7UJF7_9FUNG|nr:hypothetical protein INT44_002166 [Umbelopsis vinacea]
MDIHTQYAASSSLPLTIPASTSHIAGRSILTPSVTSIPIETPLQKKNLGHYIQKDYEYQRVLNKQRNGHIQLAKQKKRDIEMYNMEKDYRHRLQSHYFAPGYRGPGNAPTNGPSQILYPIQRAKRFKSSEIRVGVAFSREQNQKEERLVPIRIDLEAEGYRLSDTFTWNLNETVISPEAFAAVLCDDLSLPAPLFATDIAKAIREQTEDYYLHAPAIPESDKSSPPCHQLQETAPSGLELRTLDITVGNRALIDQFEWDIASQNNSPEQFADILATDLGLGGEFKTAIAHSIREQVHVYLKSLLLIGYEFDGAPVDDDELKQVFLPRVKKSIRNDEVSVQFTPVVLHLTDVEVEKMERDRMRETRRKRRQKRSRRGVTVPDREPQKTHRTGRASAPQLELNEDQLMGETSDQGTPGNYAYTMSMRSSTSQRKSAQQARASIAADAAMNNSPVPRHPDHLSMALGMGNRLMLTGRPTHGRPY